MARWRSVTSEQVARRFLPEHAGGRQIVDRRIRAWRRFELVESARILADRPTVHAVRGPGLSLVGVDGPVRRPVVGTLEHDLAVVDMAVWLHRKHGFPIITEREVMALDRPNEPSPKLAVPAAPGAGRRLLFPDLITVTGQGSERRAQAHEVELSGRKGHRRLVALMQSYVRSDRIERVRYYAPERVRARIEDAAAEANAWGARVLGRGDRVHVTGWPWLEDFDAHVSTKGIDA